MRLFHIFPLLVAMTLTACVSTTTAPPSPTKPAAAQPLSQAQARLRANRAARQFIGVVNTVEPVAEAECKARTTRSNCDFRIVVDDRPGQPANAFQTVDNTGRPVIAFTLALIARAENPDELAFVMSHEAAHHIQGHIAQTRQNAQAGAVILSTLARAAGANGQAVRAAMEIGAAVGSRTYSKDFELQADALGTVIAKRAGYNPVVGARFFTRIPDPGDAFLGTHPPHAQRIETVRRTAQGT